MFSASEEGYDSEEAKQKLKSLVDKFGKENDEDFDFDDLNIEEDFSSEEEDGWPENSILYYFWNKKYPQHTKPFDGWDQDYLPKANRLFGPDLGWDFDGLSGDFGQAA